MRELCHNCHGFRRVWNGYRYVACPVCGNRGEYDRQEQLDIFGGKHVMIEQIQPDRRNRKWKA